MAKKNEPESKSWKLGKAGEKRESRLELEDIHQEENKKKIVRKNDPRMRESLSGSRISEEDDSIDNNDPPIGRSVESVQAKKQKKKKPQPLYKHPAFIVGFTLIACSFFTYLLYPRLGKVENSQVTLSSLDDTPGGPLISYFIPQNELSIEGFRPISYDEPLAIREGRFLSSLGQVLQISGTYYSRSSSRGSVPNISVIAAIETIPNDGNNTPPHILDYHKLELYDNFLRMSAGIGEMILTNKVTAGDVTKAGTYLQFRGRALLDSNLEDEELRNQLRIEDSIKADVLNNSEEFNDFAPTLRLILSEKLFNETRDLHDRYF